MPLVTQMIPALYGGVSQQAAVQRRRNQVEEAVNCVFSVAQGASKRPPLECITMLTSEVHDDLAVTWFQSESGEWYVLTFPGDGSYRAYRAEDGGQLALEGDSTGLPYLITEHAPSKSLRFQRVGQKLYVVNREVTTQLLAGNTAGFLSGTADTLQDDVLNTAGVNTIWQVTGSDANPFDTYFVKKIQDKWVEWVEPGIPYQIDGSTMPHFIELVPVQGIEDASTFRFSVETWTDRRVGNQSSNEAPSFIGQKINHITVAGDRLVLLSRRSVCMSRVKDYTDFWRSTVTQVLDDDRIDVTAADTQTTDLLWMQPVSGQYIVFSSEDQYVLDGEPALTPRTVSLRPVTRYPVSGDAPPVVLGPNVYFATASGQYTHLRELFLQEDAVTLSAANVSSHAFKYVPEGIKDMTGHPNFDHILMITGQSPEIYSYQFMWAGNEKILSSWGKWELASDAIPLNLHIIDQYAYVVYRKSVDGQLFLGRMNLKPGDSTPGFNHLVYLDHLQKLTPDYNLFDNKTYFVSLYPLPADPVLVRGEGWSDKGTARRLSSVASSNRMTDFMFSLPGDWTQGDVWLGHPYDQRLTLSEQFYYENNVPLMNVRCQIRNMIVHFTDTTAMRVEVKSRGRDPYHLLVFPGLKQTYTSRTLGDEYLILNSPQQDTGVYDFPVLGKASDVSIDLVNDTYLPANFQAAEWRGLISKRMTR